MNVPIALLLGMGSSYMEMLLVQNEYGWWVIDHRNDEHGPFRTEAEAQAEREGLAHFYGTFEQEDPRPMGTPSDR